MSNSIPRIAMRPIEGNGSTETRSYSHLAAPRRRKSVYRTRSMIKIFEDQDPACAHSYGSSSDQGRRNQFSSLEDGYQPSEVNDGQSQPRVKHSNPKGHIIEKSPPTQARASSGKEISIIGSRRKTAWITSDDTTACLGQPLDENKKNPFYELLSQSIKETRNGATAARQEACNNQPRRKERRKSLAQAPRRGVPLQPILRSVQEEIDPIDYRGADTGKENMPPELTIIQLTGAKSTDEVQIFTRRASLRPLSNESASSKLKRINIQNPMLDKRTIYGKPRRPSMMLPVQICQRPSPVTAQTSTRKSSIIGQPKSSKNKTKPQELIRKASLHPQVTENIEQSQMSEDSWLNNQETTMTEIINGIISKHPFCQSLSPDDTLRCQLLEVYQGKPMTLLYQRLQASLQFGALSLGKERQNGTNANQFGTDVALQIRFMRLWMDTYNEEQLRAAVEVVVDRPGNHNGTCSFLTSDLEGLIRSCLLHNEDSISLVQTSNESEFSSSSWRLTMLRGLMLIALLDRTKVYNINSETLFKASSPHKSSASVLAEFTSLLMPWGGQLSRSLGHLGYHLQHFQVALYEYDLKISNLAIDLRDGIRLARLTEILLFPKHGGPLLHEQSIVLPSGEVLDISDKNHTLGALSQHLRYPCSSRAAKLYNNQITLSALLGVSAVAEIAAKTKSSDIVDGHRENTIALLLALISQRGLNLLVDWNDIRSEIIRISSGTISGNLLQKNLTSPSQRTQKSYLGTRRMRLLISTD